MKEEERLWGNFWGEEEVIALGWGVVTYHLQSVEGISWLIIDHGLPTAPNHKPLKTVLPGVWER